MDEHIKIEEKLSRRKIRCHNCFKPIIMGEKCNKIFKLNSRGQIINELIYIVLCQRCSYDIGSKMIEGSKIMNDYNSIFLNLPEKERKMKIRMIFKMEK